MNNYIVDPMFFYWCDVANGIIGLCITLLVIILIIAMILIIDAMDKSYKYNSVFEVPKFKSRLLLLTAAAIIFGLGLVFIPSKETLIEMEIARHATYDNLDAVINKIMGAF